METVERRIIESNDRDNDRDDRDKMIENSDLKKTESQGYDRVNFKQHIKRLSQPNRTAKIRNIGK
jgi:hypothetical protein